MYSLFLDDERIPTQCRYPGDGSIYDTITDWICVNSFDTFYKILKEKGIPDNVSFDYNIIGDEDGLECAKFLKFFCEDLNKPLPKWYVHSNWPGIYTKFVEILGKQ